MNQPSLVEGFDEEASLEKTAQEFSPARVAANDDAISDAALNSSAAAPALAANDNPPIDDLPACLAVSDDEVTLLQQYLGQEILALFG